MTGDASSSTASDLRAAMRAALKDAMRARDARATSALRSAIGAVDNAEALPGGGDVVPGEGPIAGAAVGLGVTDAPRRSLTPQDVLTVVRAEVSERRAAAAEIEVGHPDRAADLHREADVLESVLANDPLG